MNTGLTYWRWRADLIRQRLLYHWEGTPMGKHRAPENPSTGDGRKIGAKPHQVDLAVLNRHGAVQSKQTIDTFGGPKS